MKRFSHEYYEGYTIFFGTLANQKRLRIINALRQKALNVGEISAVTELSQSLVSHNLHRLEHCGFVLRSVNGKYRYYSLNQKTISPLMQLIDNHMDEFCHKIARGER